MSDGIMDEDRRKSVANCNDTMEAVGLKGLKVGEEDCKRGGEN